MVEEMLVGNLLTNEMISSGKELLQTLDEKRFEISAALWLYLTENVKWILLFAIPGLNVKGPKIAYTEFYKFLEEKPNLKLSLMNIKLIDSSDGFISLLKIAIMTYSGISGIRFTGNTINGYFIEDAYIYRIT